MNTATAAAAVTLVVVVGVVATTTSAAPANFCDRHPTHRRCESPTPRPTATAVSTPSPSPSATVTPTPTVAPTAPPSVGCNVSGISIPAPHTGDTRVFELGFCGVQALGQNPNPVTGEWLRGRTCGYTDSSGRGTYCWPKTTYEQDGMLIQWLHSETVCGMTTTVNDPTGKCIYVNAPLINGGDRDNFSVYLVARFDDIPGRKIAYLNWAHGTNVNGEDDFPEAKLDGGSCKGYAFHHFDRAEKGQQSWPACVDLNDWHLYEIDFAKRTSTSSGSVTFRLDGQVLGTTTQYVPDDPMHWVGQAETYLAGQSLPYPYPNGRIYWDALALDVPQ